MLTTSSILSISFVDLLTAFIPSHGALPCDVTPLTVTNNSTRPLCPKYNFKLVASLETTPSYSIPLSLNVLSKSIFIPSCSAGSSRTTPVNIYLPLNLYPISLSFNKIFPE